MNKYNKGSALIYALMMSFSIMVLVVGYNYSSKMNLLITKSLDGGDNDNVTFIANYQVKNLFNDENLLNKFNNPNLFIGKNGFSSKNCVEIETLDNKEYCVIKKSTLNNIEQKILIEEINPILYDPKGFSSKGYFQYKFLQIAKENNKIIFKKEIFYNTNVIESYDDKDENLKALNVPLTNPLKINVDNDILQKLGGYIGAIKLVDNESDDNDYIEIIDYHGKQLYKIDIPQVNTERDTMYKNDDSNSTDIPYDRQDNETIELFKNYKLKYSIGWFLKDDKWKIYILAYRVPNIKNATLDREKPYEHGWAAGMLFISKYNDNKIVNLNGTSLNSYYIASFDATDLLNRIEKNTNSHQVNQNGFKSYNGQKIVNAVWATRKGVDHPLITAITQISRLRDDNYSSVAYDAIYIYYREEKLRLISLNCVNENCSEINNTPIEGDFTMKEEPDFFDEVYLKSVSIKNDLDFYINKIFYLYIPDNEIDYLYMSQSNINIERTLIDGNNFKNNSNKYLFSIFHAEDYKDSNNITNLGILINLGTSIKKYVMCDTTDDSTKICAVSDKTSLPSGITIEKAWLIDNYYLIQTNISTLYAYNIGNGDLILLPINMIDYPNADFFYKDNELFIQKNSLECLIGSKSSSFDCMDEKIDGLSLPQLGVINQKILNI